MTDAPDAQRAYIMGAITSSLLKDGWKFHVADTAEGVITLDVEHLCGPSAIADLRVKVIL